MKIISFFLFLLLSAIKLNGQADLKFDKRYVECEDKWVAFQAKKDSATPFGFIYIDAQAGLTFQYEGNYTIGTDGKMISKKLMENGVYKVRLEPNNVQVALLPANRLAELGVPEIPDWLQNYKATSDSVGRMVRWGYFYNHWGESSKALTYLEKAYQLDPAYKSVEFELSFAYNALERYNEAIVVLEKAIKRDPGACLLYKELSYAQLFMGKIEEAKASCNQGIAQCEDKKMKAEIAYNITYIFYTKKDKANFAAWATETRKWAESESVFLKNIGIMEKKLAE